MFSDTLNKKNEGICNELMSFIFPWMALSSHIHVFFTALHKDKKKTVSENGKNDGIKVFNIRRGGILRKLIVMFLLQ